MSGLRMIGLVVLVLGVVLLCVGINASNSVADQVKHTVTGTYRQETAWYIFGGLAVAVGGLVALAAPKSKP